MNKKNIELTEEFIINESGNKLFRIKCIGEIKGVKIGQIGGFVESEKNISGNGWVSGNAQVYGNAQVSGNAYIKSNNDHCGFDCFGSTNRHTHAYLTSENKIQITCGCFTGSIEEFENIVKRTHSGNEYEQQYNAIINVIKIKFNQINERTNQTY